MLVINFCLLLLLSFQVYADEPLLEIRGKVEDVYKHKGLTCYVCTSYLPQCNGTVDNTQKWVPQMLCKGKCFARVGEENTTALYRGCTDGWNKVDELDFNYVGCRNHTWNGVTRLWCLCETDRCNGHSLQELANPNRTRSYAAVENKKESLSYSINVRGHPGQTEHAIPLGHFKDYNHAYDNDNVAYRDKGQYYDDTVYDDSYVDAAKYNHNYVKEKKEQKGRVYPSPLPQDIHTPIQEDKEGYIRRKASKKTRSQYKDMHHTIEEYKPKTRRTGNVRTYRSETRTEKFEGKDRGHTGHVREDSYAYRDNQGRDYPLYTQDKFFTDIDQVHYGENNDIYVKRSEIQKKDKPYISPDVPKPFWDPLYSDNFVQDGYYPHEHELPVYNTRENQEDEPQYQNLPTTTTTTTSTHPAPTEETPYPTADYILGQGSNMDHPMPGERVFCSETGFYQHPTDCSAFIACTIDDHVGKPVMNHMRCPKGLFWDNTRRTCDYYSSTCKDSAAHKNAHLIELADYEKDYDKLDNEKERGVEDQNLDKPYTDLEESQGYEELDDASFESKKAYFTD